MTGCAFWWTPTATGSHNLRPSCRRGVWKVQPIGGGTPFEAGLPERAWGFDSLTFRHGEWRSLVAHPVWGRRAAGSNPVSPTSHLVAQRPGSNPESSGIEGRIQPMGGGIPFEAGLPERAWGFDSLILRHSSTSH